jgi:hypothetical protein
LKAEDIIQLNQSEITDNLKAFIAHQLEVEPGNLWEVNPILIYNLVFKEGLTVRYDSLRYMKFRDIRGNYSSIPIGMKTIMSELQGEDIIISRVTSTIRTPSRKISSRTNEALKIR